MSFSVSNDGNFSTVTASRGFYGASLGLVSFRPALEQTIAVADIADLDLTEYSSALLTVTGLVTPGGTTERLTILKNDISDNTLIFASVSNYPDAATGTPLVYVRNIVQKDGAVDGSFDLEVVNVSADALNDDVTFSLLFASG